MAVFFPLRMGHTNAYLIETTKGTILVDAGMGRKQKVIVDELKRLGIGPKELLLVIISHVHYDHVGSLASIRDLTEAEILVHEAERECLETGKSIFPEGTRPFTKFLAGRIRRRIKDRRLFAPVSPTIVIDGEYDLDRFGVEGKIVPTPGHSIGSVSVILRSGEAFIGDTGFNVTGISRKSVFPPWAQDIEALGKSWKLLLDTGAGMFYPGHGKPFDREKLQRSFELRFSHKG